MRARLPLTVALALATPLLLAESAKPRDHSSSGSHSSSADRHPSSSSGSHSSSSTSSRSSSSSHSSATPRTEAQARHPRPGSGHSSRGGHYYPGYGGYYGGYYGGGYYGRGYYGGYYRSGYPYYGYWSSPYYSAPYYPYRRSYRDYAALRVLVEPEQTRVYVDGYFAGTADEFDGIFQRLNVSPGRHEITLKLEGYRTHRVRMYIPEGNSVKLRHDMQRGQGEDALDDRVGPSERDDARADREADPEADREDNQREPMEREPAAGGRDDADAGTPADAATLRLHVTPEDASIYVDGRFRGTGRQLDDLLMPPGKHRVEIVRPGFRTYDQELDVLGEEPLDLKIALERP